MAQPLPSSLLPPLPSARSYLVALQEALLASLPPPPLTAALTGPALLLVRGLVTL